MVQEHPESPDSLEGCDSLRSSFHCGASVVSLSERGGRFHRPPI